MKTPDTKTILNIALIIGIIVVGKKIFNFLGITKTTEDIQAQTLDTASTETPTKVDLNKPYLSLTPDYWQIIGGYINNKLKAQNKPILTAAQIRAKLLLFPENSQNGTFVQQINKAVIAILNSKGLFNDDEDALYNIFTKLKSQFAISYVADQFGKQTNKNMFNYIKGFTNSEEQAKLYNILKNKPLI